MSCPAACGRIDDATREDLRLSRIRRALDQGAWELAAVEAEELLEESPRHPEGLFLLGEALLEVGDFDLALLCYQQRVALDGGDMPSWLGLAISAFQNCDFQLAIATARKVIQEEPGNAEAHYYLGLALERIPGHAVESISALTAAMQLDPLRYPLPMQLDRDGWRQVIYSALDLLHPRLQHFYSGMDFRLEDLPNLTELQRTHPPLPPTIGAMYVGEPPEEPNTGRPSAMRLFLRNLGRSLSEEQLVEQLGTALQEEALHWLALSPEDLDEESPLP